MTKGGKNPSCEVMFLFSCFFLDFVKYNICSLRAEMTPLRTFVLIEVKKNNNL